MPQILKSIDQLGREKKRDVLYVFFANPQEKSYIKDHPRRPEVIDFLEKNQIPYEKCYPYWHKDWIQIPYYGHLYIDIPFEKSLPKYQLLEDYFEMQILDKNGQLENIMKDPEVIFACLPYSDSLENAFMDEEGYDDNL